MLPPTFEEYDFYPDGRVFSHRSNKFLKPRNRNGYLGFRLYTARGTFEMAQHRIVAGLNIPNPDNRPMVNHKNGNRADNRPENLEWVTAVGNIRHAIRTGARPRGERHFRAALNEQQVQEIYAAKGQKTQMALAKQYGVAQCTIKNILNHRTWKHVTKAKETL